MGEGPGPVRCITSIAVVGLTSRSVKLSGTGCSRPVGTRLLLGVV